LQRQLILFGEREEGGRREEEGGRRDEGGRVSSYQLL